jgi:hypothetical protein
VDCNLRLSSAARAEFGAADRVVQTYAATRWALVRCAEGWQRAPYFALRKLITEILANRNSPEYVAL